ncbi:hypothetical protein KCP73_19715 [Salmonella enterica subsp. enterica]|nr:hypothetical protein KCP73_19715 [Salmonella enterica subsp. enterica]
MVVSLPTARWSFISAISRAQIDRPILQRVIKVNPASTGSRRMEQPVRQARWGQS